MRSIPRTNSVVVIAGFTPGIITRLVLVFMTLTAGAISMAGFLLAVLDGYALESKEAWAVGWAVGVGSFFFLAFAAFWAGFRSETALDAGRGTITDLCTFFGIGRRRSYGLDTMYQVRIERRFVGSTPPRIRFQLSLIGTDNKDESVLVCLGSYLTIGGANGRAKEIHRLTQLPIHYVDNATIRSAAKRAGRALSLPLRMSHAITQVGMWPVRQLIRSFHKDAGSP
jgi:hypothetical protein